jgi:predicted alpha/beta hydrolase
VNSTGSDLDLLRMPDGATARWHDGGDDGPVLVTWPALGVPGRAYGRFARAMSATGLAVVTADYRGQGDSDLRITRESRFGYPELAEDLRDVAAAVRERAPGRPVHLVCHSLGGQLAAALEAGHPGSFDGLVLAAAGTPHWRAYPGRTRAIPLVGIQVQLASARRRGVLDSKRFGRQSATLVADWARMARTGSWARGGHETAPRRFPLLAVSFDGDSLAPPGAVDALCRLFPGADVTRRHLPEPRGHAGWLREPQALVDAVHAWLPEKAAEQP